MPISLDLSGRHAIVCGSTSGIGRAIAHRFAEAGADVSLLARSEDRLRIVLDELAELRPNGQFTFRAADFTTPEAVRKAVHDLIVQRDAHILVNNTGGPPPGELNAASTEALAKAFRMHVLANQHLVQAVASSMRAQGGGRIINVISTSVKEPLPGLGVSNTIRGAVANWAKTLANELGPHGITVNNILPGFTQTERLNSLIMDRAQQANKAHKAVAQQMAETVPLGRFARAEEIANAALFLASDLAAYISGINLPVDGGRTRSL